MKVENRIRIYEINDEEEVSELLISSDCFYHDLIVIRYGETKITVSAEDLIKAIKNATNW